MDLNEIVMKDIIQLCSTVHVYEKQCNKVKEFINIINDNWPKISSNINNLQSILDQLNILYKLIDNFTLNKWMENRLSTPVMEPISKLFNIINSINENLKIINISIKDEYYPDQQSIIDDIKDIKNKFSDISQSQDPQLSNRLTEINEYLQEVEEMNKSKQKNSKHKKPSSNIKQSFEISPSSFIIETDPLESNDWYEIYEGKMLKTEEKVKIMKFKGEDPNNEHFNRLFEVLSKVEHPNLESFIGAVKNPPYFIITRLEGEKLFDILDNLKTEEIRRKNQKKKRKNSEEKNDENEVNYCKTTIAFNIAKAMAYVHSLNIIHRDLCSDNIYVDSDSNPRISNFANSRFIPGDSFLLTISMKPSKKFRAPEFSDDYDESVDVFSFGGILYNLLTNSPPFSKYDLSEVETKIKNCERPPLPTNISDDLKELIESCWHQNSKYRPSFSDIIDKMIEKRITFPSDEDSTFVSNFYDDKIISDKTLIVCLKYINDIINFASNCDFYRKELYRVKLVIFGYKSILQAENFIPIIETKKTKILNRLKKMAKILNRLKNITENLNNLNYELKFTDEERNLKHELKSTDEEKYIKTFKKFSPTQIPKNIVDHMKKIHHIMKKIGFNAAKYKLENDDLAHDLREIYQRLDIHSKYYLKKREFCNQLKEEIINYLDQYGIKINVTQDEIDEKIKKTLYQFKDYYVERKNFNKVFKLGKGVSSIVYKAKKDKNEIVAIKEFNISYKKDDKHIMYFRREISFLMSLKNDYLISFIGFNDDEGKPLWIITKYAENGNLYERKSDLSPLQKTKIAFNIAKGMLYIHKKNVIHRDLKTSNILLDENDDPKISDFGFSRINISLEISQKVGTSGYMAPEVDDGGFYDYKADVFSYGVILWELCLLKNPSNWDNDVKLLTEINSENLASLIKNCTSKVPSERPDFSEIMKRMISEKIAFDGADQDEIDSFYEMKANEISS